jgi:HK97 family phage prohead protease
MSTEITTVPLELRASTDGAGLDGLCVPYGSTTLKAGYPKGERFLPGSFADLIATNGAAKIRLTDSHDESGRRPIGVATEFREEEAGLWGRFRFYNTPEGRGGRENVVEQTYGGLSVGFLPVAERVGDDGAREIVRARLFHVSLVDEPAYSDARVLAVRSALPDVSALLAVSYDVADLADPPDLARLVFGVRS